MTGVSNEIVGEEPSSCQPASVEIMDGD